VSISYHWSNSDSQIGWNVFQHNSTPVHIIETLTQVDLDLKIFGELITIQIHPCCSCLPAFTGRGAWQIGKLESKHKKRLTHNWIICLIGLNLWMGNTKLWRKSASILAKGLVILFYFKFAITILLFRPLPQLWPLPAVIRPMPLLTSQVQWCALHSQEWTHVRFKQVCTEIFCAKKSGWLLCFWCHYGQAFNTPCLTPSSFPTY
jgi:hypothetical protein